MPDKLKPIKLGLLAPRSGIVEIYGQEICWAAKIATKIVNENGGILGRPLELIIADDGSIPETAVPAAQRLIQKENCSAIIGNLLSNSRISVAYQVAEPLKVPYLNFSFYEGSISSRYFFHFAALPNQQIDKMIPYMMNNIGPKMFFAGSDYEWPRGSIDAAKKALTEAGGEVVGEHYYKMGEADFDQLLGDVSRSGADVFVPYFAGIEQVNLLTRFTGMGLKSKMAVVMGHFDEVMVSCLPKEVRENFYSSNSYFMTVNTKENKNYLKLLSQRDDVDGIWPHGNGVLTNFGEGAYVCVRAYADAVNKAGTLETAKVLEALKNISVSAPQGIVKMDPDTQHAMVNSYLTRCRSDGSFEIIEEFGLIEPHMPSRYGFSDLSKRSSGNEVQKTQQTSPIILPAKMTDAESGEIQEMVLTDSFSDAFNIVEVAIIAVNKDGKIVRVNETVEALFGYTAKEIVGQSVSILIPPRFREAHGQHIEDFFISKNHSVTMGNRGEIWGYRKDGREFPAEAALTTFKIDNETYYTALLREVSKYKEAEEELKWRASHDALTKLPNQATIMKRLSNALSRARRSGGEVAVLFIDLDNFKLINDSYGHSIGDLLLVSMAERLLKVVRSGDIVSRFSGDEFVILCENFEDKMSPALLAESINVELRKPLEIEGIDLFPSCSVGIAYSSEGDLSVKNLLSNADAAMYQAKDNGRDGWIAFNIDIHNKVRENLYLANGLRTAIEKDEFFSVFQPIIDTASGEVKGLEMLLRWEMDGKLIPPDKFIPVAETSGNINSIGAWVFEQACKAQVKLAEQYGPQTCPYISVNVSSRELEQDDYFENVCRIYSKTGANPFKILIEITETALMADVEQNLKLLKSLNERGFQIAIDDFGTGYSSLSQLTKLPLAILKVDRAFITKLLTSETDLAVAKAVVSMAHALNLKVIAEGVELKEQREILSKLNVNYCQGYYFAKPMPLNEFFSKKNQPLWHAPPPVSDKEATAQAPDYEKSSLEK